MDVGDHRQGRAGHDRGKRVGVGPTRHRHSHDLAARLVQARDLGKRRRHVAGVGQGHRLDGDGGTPADQDSPDRYLALRSHGAEDTLWAQCGPVVIKLPRSF